MGRHSIRWTGTRAIRRKKIAPFVKRVRNADDEEEYDNTALYSFGANNDGKAK